MGDVGGADPIRAGESGGLAGTEWHCACVVDAAACDELALAMEGAPTDEVGAIHPDLDLGAPFVFDGADIGGSGISGDCGSGAISGPGSMIAPGVFCCTAAPIRTAGLGAILVGDAGGAELMRDQEDLQVERILGAETHSSGIRWSGTSSSLHG